MRAGDKYKSSEIYSSPRDQALREEYNEYLKKRLEEIKAGKKYASNVWAGYARPSPKQLEVRRLPPRSRHCYNLTSYTRGRFLSYGTSM